MTEPTVRDQFAMSALNGMVASHYFSRDHMSKYVDDAYVFADLMMERRKTTVRWLQETKPGGWSCPVCRNKGLSDRKTEDT